jgi:hypothetical protein
MDLVLAKLDRIEKRLEAIEKGCVKMNDHVNFVERAYKVVRAPLNYVLERLKGAEELPALENKTLLNDKEE